MANKIFKLVKRLNNIIKTKIEQRRIKNEKKQDRIYRNKEYIELYNNPHRMAYNVVGGTGGR
uniref:Uncharacterized protein n=1 Tax=viral metagenome TaxID=1070528 RepID=A0A6C0J314_9ZZZZ